MKNSVKLMMISIMLILISLSSKAQTAASSYIGSLDTLTNTDTATYVTTITGKKEVIAWQINVTKISGTVAGTIRLEGSVDGTNYETALVVSATTITDASANYVVKLTSNPYRKYRLRVISSGTNSASHRVYLRYF